MRCPPAAHAGPSARTGMCGPAPRYRDVMERSPPSRGRPRSRCARSPPSRRRRSGSTEALISAKRRHNRRALASSASPPTRSRPAGRSHRTTRCLWVRRQSRFLPWESRKDRGSRRSHRGFEPLTRIISTVGLWEGRKPRSKRRARLKLPVAL